MNPIHSRKLFIPDGLIQFLFHPSLPSFTTTISTHHTLPQPCATSRRHQNFTKKKKDRTKDHDLPPLPNRHQAIFKSQASSEILCNLIQSCSSPDSPSSPLFLFFNPASLLANTRIRPSRDLHHPSPATPPNRIASSPLLVSPGRSRCPTNRQPASRPKGQQQANQ